jgi:hypothetical protein
MSLETTFRSPRGYSYAGNVDGQGRVISFLVRRLPEPPRVVAIHLDYPGVTVEADIPRTYTNTAVGRVSDAYFFSPSPT